MRIIAGLHRGRPILPPAGRQTRPITDRVKESLFGILTQRLEGAWVADIFAGTGSLGLEALSRGADSCCFVESDRKAKALLWQNIKTLDLQDKVQVSSKNAWNFAESLETERSFDLIFLDPPYVDSRDSSEESKLGKLLASVSGEDLLSREGMVVLRHESAYPCQERYGQLTLAQSRRYGSMSLSFFVREDESK